MEIATTHSTTSEYWETNVHELVSLFRDALFALAPIFKKAHIPFEKDEDQYDDFDGIAKALFEQIVINSIKFSFSDNDLTIEMPNYGFPFDVERDFAFVEIASICDENDKSYYAFRKLSSQKDLFDAVNCDLLDNNLQIVQGKAKVFAFEKCDFKLIYKQGKDMISTSAINVLL